MRPAFKGETRVNYSTALRRCAATRATKYTAIDVFAVLLRMLFVSGIARAMNRANDDSRKQSLRFLGGRSIEQGLAKNAVARLIVGASKCY